MDAASSPARVRTHTHVRTFEAKEWWAPNKPNTVRVARLGAAPHERHGMEMAMRHSKFLVLFACAALALAAVGCGDDTSSNGGTDAGQDSGPQAGTGGGKEDSSTPDPTQCTTDTVAVGAPADCAACVCEMATAAAADCAADTNCWPLISCVADKCATDTSIVCAGQMCGAYIQGAGPAMALQATLQGPCASKCVAPSGTDGGTDDGGADAGN